MCSRHSQEIAKWDLLPMNYPPSAPIVFPTLLLFGDIPTPSFPLFPHLSSGSNNKTHLGVPVMAQWKQI